MDWNTSYQKGRDYKQLSTTQLLDVLGGVGALPFEAGDKKALDIGCGTGQLARDLYHLGYEVTGVDLSSAAIEMATTSTRRDGVSFVVCDIETLEAPLGMFDLITCKYVFAFLAEPLKFLQNIQQMMKPGAYFVMVTPDQDTLSDQKKGIALPSGLVEEKLQAVFGASVHRTRVGDDFVYICGAGATAAPAPTQ